MQGIRMKKDFEHLQPHSPKTSADVPANSTLFLPCNLMLLDNQVRISMEWFSLLM
jgi:hypothetical protein